MVLVLPLFQLATFPENDYSMLMFVEMIGRKAQNLWGFPKPLEMRDLELLASPIPLNTRDITELSKRNGAKTVV
jgi:hypothetical protein